MVSWREFIVTEKRPSSKTKKKYDQALNIELSQLVTILKTTVSSAFIGSSGQEMNDDYGRKCCDE